LAPLTIYDRIEAARGQAASLSLARAKYKEETRALQELDAKRTSLLEAQILLQSLAKLVQEKVHERVASVVSRCLEAVFEEPYTFRIDFEQKRGRTEARLVFERDGMCVDPLTASGGGVIDVAAFALRLSCLLLIRPPLRRVLIMDEPFRFVSPDLRGRVRSLLQTLSTEMGIQFIIITHMEELVLGQVVRLPQEGL
jgi:hypothetical protein